MRTETHLPHKHAHRFRNLNLRSDILAAVRVFFSARGYLEVETPIRIPAPAPEAFIEAEPAADWYLQTSPELCMKRLLAGGVPRIFQICKCFRQNERGARHLPEFTMLEWYEAGGNYAGMMGQTEALICHIAETLGIGPTLSYQGRNISLKRPWPRMSVEAAYQRSAAASAHEACQHDRFDILMVEAVEPRLDPGRPVFLYDYPLSRGALARPKAGNGALAERFELYMGGLELCNGFSELTDMGEQTRRFEAEQNRRRAAGLDPYPSPARFLEALGRMPESGGNALGLDRLVMLFANSTSIDDVVAFTPQEL